MWNFIVSLCVKILAAYTGSPYAQEIVRQVVVDLANEGKKSVPVIVDAVKEAALDDNLTSRGKFDYVSGKLVVEAQGIGRSVADSLVTYVYRALKNDPAVPEVR